MALPVNESALGAEAERARAAALSRFEKQRFGTGESVEGLRAALRAALDKALA